MKLPVAFLLAMSALVVLGSCGSTRGRTVELPGGVTPEEMQASQGREPNFFDRLVGRDPRTNPGPCPVMGVLYDSSRIVQFNDPAQERYANIEYTGEMNGVHGLCRYAGEDPITLSMDIDMAFGRGPASSAERRTYRYWVAVTRRGLAPIEKAYFDVDVRFPNGQAVVTHTEHIEEIVIPRANATTSGENFEVLVGFELTPQQLAFNREGKRFRVDASAQGQ
jgi:hypothetical protein